MTERDRGFRLPRLCLPRRDIDLSRWAVIACDQYTSEPEYWQGVEKVVGDAPSTLRLTFPEVYLESADAAARVGAIQQSMQRYSSTGLLEEHEGLVLVEREVDGRTRRGLMLELDLECYDFSPESTSLIRPTEGTIVARLAPRMAVRRDALLELPHILVLIDDPQCTVIEPLVAQRPADASPLYDTALMCEGGRVTGHAVDAAAAARALTALDALAQPGHFAARYGVPPGTPPMLFAVGDGNHSLATAKAVWDSSKGTLGPDHPARYALVEVENIHDPALHFAPIHRVLFGVTGDWRAALSRAFGDRLRWTPVPDGNAMNQAIARGACGGDPAAGAAQVFGLVEPGPRWTVVEIQHPPAALTVGSLQPVIDAFVADGGAASIDYVHGDDVVERLGAQPGCLGLALPALGKHELLTRVVQGGPLPRKTFSMGEAHEKRFYMEARRIR